MTLIIFVFFKLLFRTKINRSRKAKKNMGRIIEESNTDRKMGWLKVETLILYMKDEHVGSIKGGFLGVIAISLYISGI